MVTHDFMQFGSERTLISGSFDTTKSKYGNIHVSLFVIVNNRKKNLNISTASGFFFIYIYSDMMRIIG